MACQGSIRALVRISVQARSFICTGVRDAPVHLLFPMRRGLPMVISRRAVLMLAATFTLGTSLVVAQHGARQLPTRDIPVPGTVSPILQAVIGAPLSPIW